MNPAAFKLYVDVACVYPWAELLTFILPSIKTTERQWEQCHGTCALDYKIDPLTYTESKQNGGLNKYFATAT